MPLDSDSVFASLGQKELEGEKEAYRVLTQPTVVEALAIVQRACDGAFSASWSDVAQEALMELDRALSRLKLWKAQMEEEVL